MDNKIKEASKLIKTAVSAATSTAIKPKQQRVIINTTIEKVSTYENAYRLIRSRLRGDVEEGIKEMTKLFKMNDNGDHNSDNLIYNMAYGYFRLGSTLKLYELFHMYHDPRIYELIERDEILKYKNDPCGNNGVHEILRLASSGLILISVGSFILNRM